MLIKLDQELIDLLCCPYCKSDIELIDEVFICTDCKLKFSKKKLNIDNSHVEYIYDFRISIPDYCIPESRKRWINYQNAFEYDDFQFRNSDREDDFIDQINSVKEIYRDEYRLSGKVLDVGGHQGLLRQHLDDNVSLYVSIDPYGDMFRGLYSQTNLTKVYPCLLKEDNFLLAHAEYLPFKSQSFDWVHMRSVVDHFENPFMAFLEAFRCSKAGGKLLVGLAIIERLNYKVENDDHAFRFTYNQLIDIFNKTGWSVTKEHWQKHPWNFVIYANAQKI
jgi:ubiquinone/menaquinone biosynthesis C-methylase UbiE